MSAPLEDRRKEFAFEQYKLVREELAAVIARLHELFRYALLGIVIVYSWVIGQAFGVDDVGHCLKLPRTVIVTALVLPPAFILYAVIVSWLTGKLIGWIGVYLRRCEEGLGYADLCYTDHIKKRQGAIDRGMNAAWLIVFVFASAASVYLIYEVVGKNNGGHVYSACKAKP